MVGLILVALDLAGGALVTGLGSAGARIGGLACETGAFIGTLERGGSGERRGAARGGAMTGLDTRGGISRDE